MLNRHLVWNSLNYPMTVAGIVNVYIGIEIDDPITGLTGAQGRLVDDC